MSISILFYLYLHFAGTLEPVIRSNRREQGIPHCRVYCRAEGQIRRVDNTPLHNTIHQKYEH
jgi:hypothetical protein